MYYRYAIAALGELLAAVRACEQQLALCAQTARDICLRQSFDRRAARCSTVAREIAELLQQLGGDPASAFPGNRRGCSALPDIADDEILIETAERGEDRALEVYRNALDEHLPELVRQVILRQFENVMSDRSGGDVRQ